MATIFFHVILSFMVVMLRSWTDDDVFILIQDSGGHPCAYSIAHCTIDSGENTELFV